MGEGIDRRSENTEAEFCSWKVNLCSASCLRGKNSK